MSTRVCCICWEFRDQYEDTVFLGIVCAACRTSPLVREHEHHYQMNGGLDFAHGIMVALLAEATARAGGWLPSEEVERLQKIDAAAKALAEVEEDFLEAEEFSQRERDAWIRARDLEKDLYRLVRSIPSTTDTSPSS